MIQVIFEWKIAQNKAFFASIFLCFNADYYKALVFKFKIYQAGLNLVISKQIRPGIGILAVRPGLSPQMWQPDRAKKVELQAARVKYRPLVDTIASLNWKMSRLSTNHLHIFLNINFFSNFHCKY